MFLASRYIVIFAHWPQKVKLTIWPEVGSNNLTWWVIQFGQVAHQPLGYDKTNTTETSARLYLYSVSSYWRKHGRDLLWRHMTCRGSQASSYAWFNARLHLNCHGCLNFSWKLKNKRKESKQWASTSTGSEHDLEQDHSSTNTGQTCDLQTLLRTVEEQAMSKIRPLP